MKKIKFLGASGTVTGSNFLLHRNDEPGILIDMGMFQGPSKIEDLNHLDIVFDPQQLAGVVLTHAHLDHCGRLPILMKHGFSKKIYMTKPTADLIEITLLDAVHIAEHDKDKTPMYSEEDVMNLLSLIEIVEYHKEFMLAGFAITMYDAGHIMGSASLKIVDTMSDDGVSEMVFSGDIGNYPQDLLKPTEMLDKADIVVMESTYGGRVHSTEDPADILAQEIKAIEATGGTLLIPSFSIERTQELLHRLDHLKADKRIQKDTAVFLDSPMAVRTTEIYRKYRNLYNVELTEHISHDDPFDFPGLFSTEKQKESEKIHAHVGAKVILAGSGMMTGGRIVRHAVHYLPLETTRLLFVGYQGEETLGREIQEGARIVKIDGKEIEIKATVTSCNSMSAHADEPRLLAWLKNIQGVKKVFLVHGDDQPRADLSKSISSQLGITDIVLPIMNDELSLG